MLLAPAAYCQTSKMDRLRTIPPGALFLIAGKLDFSSFNPHAS